MAKTRRDRLCKHITLQTVHAICKALVKNNGDHHAAYEETKHLTNVTPYKVYDVKHKRSYPDISDEYFGIFGNKFIPIKGSPINTIEELKEYAKARIIRKPLCELIGVIFDEDQVNDAIESAINSKMSIDELMKMAR